MPATVPIIDLAPWFTSNQFTSNQTARARVAAQVDAALRSVGFFLIAGHGGPAELPARVRAQARAFFALPGAVKQQYAVTVAGRGWLPTGVEGNGYAEGTETPPDLKESFAVGADQPTGDPAADGYWFQPNVYPAEVPGLQPAVTGYLARMRELADDLLVICAAALGLDRDFFTRHTGHATHTMNINWYPQMTGGASPEPGQYRIARAPTSAPSPSWTASRAGPASGVDPANSWGCRTTRARSPSTRVTCWPRGAATGDVQPDGVLPPQAEAPDEDLVSLVYFYEADHDAVIESLQPPIGLPNDFPPVVSGQFIKTRLDAITLS